MVKTLWLADVPSINSYDPADGCRDLLVSSSSFARKFHCFVNLHLPIPSGCLFLWSLLALHVWRWFQISPGSSPRFKPIHAGQGRSQMWGPKQLDQPWPVFQAPVWWPSHTASLSTAALTRGPAVMPPHPSGQVAHSSHFSESLLLISSFFRKSLYSDDQPGLCLS